MNRGTARPPASSVADPDRPVSWWPHTGYEPPWFLYVLDSPVGGCVKVGVSRDLNRRVSRIERAFGEVDAGTSFAVSGRHDRVLALEQAVHVRFRRLRRRRRPAGESGHTEWLARGVRAPLRNLLRDLAERDSGLLYHAHLADALRIASVPVRWELSRAQVEALAQLALREGRSLDSLVNEAISDGLAKHGIGASSRPRRP